MLASTNEKLHPKRRSFMHCIRQAEEKFPRIIASCNSINMRVFVWVKLPNPDARGAKDVRIEIGSYKKTFSFLSNKHSSIVDGSKIIFSQ